MILLNKEKINESIQIAKYTIMCNNNNNICEPLWRACNIHSSTGQWSTRLLPVMRDSGSIPRGLLMWNQDSPVSIVSILHPKRHTAGEFYIKQRGNCLGGVHSDQMVLKTVRQEAGPQERWPKALKSKLAQEQPSVLSPHRSDGSCDSQTGGWTSWKVVKDTQGRVGKKENKSRKPKGPRLKLGIVTA
jgi:hypothetical protein